VLPLLIPPPVYYSRFTVGQFLLIRRPGLDGGESVAHNVAQSADPLITRFTVGQCSTTVSHPPPMGYTRLILTFLIFLNIPVLVGKEDYSRSGIIPG